MVGPLPCLIIPPLPLMGHGAFHDIILVVFWGTILRYCDLYMYHLGMILPSPQPNSVSLVVPYKLPEGIGQHSVSY